MFLVRIRAHWAGVVVAAGHVKGHVGPGLHLRSPFRRVVTVDLRPHVLDIVSQKLRSSDGTDMDYRYKVRYSVKDPEVAAMAKVHLHDDLERYMTEDPAANLMNIPMVIGYSCHYALRKASAMKRRTECLRKDEVADALRTGLIEVFGDTGIAIEDVKVTDAYPTNKGIEEGVAAITFQVVRSDGKAMILPIEDVDVHPAGLRRKRGVRGPGEGSR